MPLVADTSLRRYDDITVNSPSDTSVVVVEPQAYDCDIRAGGTLPAWIVRGVQDNGGGAMQVATLTQNTNKGALHRGQYQLPFEIRIEATSCMAR